MKEKDKWIKKFRNILRRQVKILLKVYIKNGENRHGNE